MTYAWGYYFNQGKKVGYNIYFGDFIIWNVSSKDYKRVVREIKKDGYSEDEIKVEKVENN